MSSNTGRTTPTLPRPKEHDASTASDLHVEVWGDGTPVVLLHGSLATSTDEWPAQRPLAEEGFRLIMPDRRGYGRSPAAPGEDYFADADDALDLIGTGAHVVGHSYGGLSAMFAAARRPEAVLSLTLLEPPGLSLAGDDPVWQALVDKVHELWGSDLPDDEWVVEFLVAVGSDPSEFPPDFLDAALPLVPLLRNSRAFDEVELPLAELASATFPKLVVSGGHHQGFDAMCDDLAVRIGATRSVVAGAGHEIQFAAPAINEALKSLWSQSA